MDWRLLGLGLSVDIGGMLLWMQLYGYVWRLRSLQLINDAVLALALFFVGGLALVLLGLMRQGIATSDQAGGLAFLSFVLAGVFLYFGGWDDTADCGDAYGRKWWVTDLANPNSCDIWLATPNRAFLYEIYWVAILTSIVVLLASLLVLRRNSAEPSSVPSKMVWPLQFELEFFSEGDNSAKRGGHD
jgi:hypothetical protein